MAFDLMILSFFGPQRRKLTQILDSSIQADSAVVASSYGLQSPSHF
jgi:hypothetical protein